MGVTRYSLPPRVMWGLAALLLGATSLLASGCETLGYYSQAVVGQARVLHKRRPVAAVVAELEQIPDPDEHDTRLLVGLKASQEVLSFAEAELGIDAGRRYRTYVELSGTHVVWNVFAAPELSFQARTWCYPMVGCAPYRGYFSESRAARYAQKLAARGDDVYLGGVAAYSTLGWFNDPLLSSFVGWPEANLAELLIHELAHGQVWVKGDVGFNEAFATFVGRYGASQWIEQRQGSAAAHAYAKRGEERLEMVRLLLAIRTALQKVFLTEVGDEAKRREKSALLARAQACYERNRKSLGSGRFDAQMASLNNAYLVSLATYQDNVPAFAAIHAQVGGDWNLFYAAVAELGRLRKGLRVERLRLLLEQDETHARDDHRADQIQCEPLFDHGFDAEATGAEHDDVRRGGHR